MSTVGSIRGWGHRSRRPWAASWMLAGAAALTGPAAAQQYKLGNARENIVLTKTATGSACGCSASCGYLSVVRIEKLEGGGAYTAFRTQPGPVFGIELRSLTAPTLPPVLIPGSPSPYAPTSAAPDPSAQTIGPHVLPLADLDLTCLGCSDPSVPGSGAILTWTFRPGCGGNTTSQTLTVTVTITMRNGTPDFMSVWDLSASITSGPYGIYAVRFPYFAMAQIGASGMDDQLLSPFAMGTLLDNPIDYQVGTHGNQFSEREGGDVLDPNGSGAVPTHEGSTSDAYFSYPGQVCSQFMAYYDDATSADGNRAGLYVQTEDPSGTTKNLYFNVATSALDGGKRLFSYYTHFNTISSQAPPAFPDPAEFQSFSLTGKLGYDVVVGVFDGDWYDATQTYRAWLTSRALLPAPLYSRTNIEAALKVSPYSVRYQLKPFDDTNPAFNQRNIDASAEYARAEALLRFYRTLQTNPGYGAGTPLMDLRPLLNVTHYSFLLHQSAGVEFNDDCSFPLRANVPQFLDMLHNPLDPANDVQARAIAMNRDTSGVSPEDAALFPFPGDPNYPLDGSAALAAEMVSNGVMRTTLAGASSRLRPMQGAQGSGTNYRTCVGSAFLRDRRTELVIRTLRASMYQGRPGFDAGALTGTGNYVYECFAPLVLSGDPADVNRAVHNHTIGGATYERSGWHQLIQSIRARASAELGLSSNFMIGLEHSPETLINDCLLGGRSFTAPYDAATDGVGRTVKGAMPVPLFGVLYHDYALSHAEAPNLQTFVDRYYPAPPPNPCDPSAVDPQSVSYGPLSANLLMRYRMARVAMQGRLLGMQISQDPLRPYETPDLTSCLVSTALLDEHEYFAVMGLLRAAVPEYLVFGQLLRDPAVLPEAGTVGSPTCLPCDDVVCLKYARPGTSTPVGLTVPRVVAGAFKDRQSGADPTAQFVGLVLTNFSSPKSGCSSRNARVSVSFDPARYGFTDASKRYKVQRKRLTNGSPPAWVDQPLTTWPLFNGGDFTYSSAVFEVGPLETDGSGARTPPWQLFRLVPEATPPGN